MPRPTLFLLHGLGLSARSWDGVVAALGDRFEIHALDLPGYGEHAGSPAITLQETAEWVAAAIRDREPDEWLIAGHSMGGKVAALVTAWAERAQHGLIAPAGLVLVGASTPEPEPMAEERRDAMAAWWTEGAISEEDAAAYVAANVSSPEVPASVRAAAVADVRRSSRVAWLEWLRRGSLEDRSTEVGVLRTPAIVVVGAEDPDLGVPNQERLTLPHVPGAPVHEIDGAGHDVLLEQPREVARFIADLGAEVAGRAALPSAFARLLASDRVSGRTRRVMLARLEEPSGDLRELSPAQHALLTEVLARVVPQRGTRLDIAGRIDAALASGAGDGWRFAELPPDAEAWRRGLDVIAAEVPGFAGLPPAEQDAAIDRIAAGDVGSDGLLTGAQMALWFQDVQAEATRAWLSHPATQAWLRYDGFADGGDDERKQGFSTTHAGEWEPWQRDWRTGKELQA